MPRRSCPPGTNQLLHALPGTIQQDLLDVAEQVPLEFAQVVCESGQFIDYVYFPLDSFISLLSTLEDGSRVEVGMAGREGMFGMDLVLGVEYSGVQAIVQGAGQALRIPAAAFRTRLEENADLRQLMSRYAAVLIAQLTRTAVCNGFHLIEPRLARWLLMCDDRSDTGTVHLTQRFLAYMLGVRRVGITRAAGNLQDQKLIDYVRGKITIRDRKGLKAVACSCYQADIDAYARLLG